MKLYECMDRAARGESLWLPELREAFAREKDAGELIIRLTGRHYGVREYSLRIPRVSGVSGGEREFLLRYAAAAVYNLLSVFSAEETVVFAEEEDARRLLAEKLPGLFEEDPGYRKVCSIARRLYGGFRICVEPLSGRDGPRGPREEPHGRGGSGQTDLAALLKKRIRTAEEKNCLGIDIGGSDIKLAASSHGRLLYTREVNWNPAAFRTAEEFMTPVLTLVREARELLEKSGEAPDAVGISFPDVVIGDRIVGGETPKTMGMRANPETDYETEFAKLGNLREECLRLLPRSASVRLANDGNMAAFTAAMELAADPAGEKPGEDALRSGILAHTLGTDLGTGWLREDGTFPPIPLEIYKLLLDIGDAPSFAVPPRDLRGTRNENSGMAGLERYLGQAAAYRLAWKLDPGLLSGFAAERDGALMIPTEPADLRKPCLERLMSLAEGNGAAEEVFRRIGSHLAMVSREMAWIFGTLPAERFLFGRFVKAPRCFALLREGFEAAEKGVRLTAADDGMANTPLMRRLAESGDVTVAQFGQAVGAIYYALD